jgi:alpha-beta hydrolase superfamily lysophospholipase
VPAGHRGEFCPSEDRELWLFHRAWVPSGPVKATLSILHGTVDHSGVYEALALALARDGVAVFASDIRGWGLSDGTPLHVETFDELVADAVARCTAVHAQHGIDVNVPRFILGKSIGGLLAAHAVARHPRAFSGLLALSGAFRIDPALAPSALTRLLLRVLAALVPRLPLKQLFDPSLIVSDPAALQHWREARPTRARRCTRTRTLVVGASLPPMRGLPLMEARQDPLVSRGKLTVGYITELQRAIDVRAPPARFPCDPRGEPWQPPLTDGGRSCSRGRSRTSGRRCWPCGARRTAWCRARATRCWWASAGVQTRSCARTRADGTTSSPSPPSPRTSPLTSAPSSSPARAPAPPSPAALAAAAPRTGRRGVR